jgi:hypothetical protein
VETDYRDWLIRDLLIRGRCVRDGCVRECERCVCLARIVARLRIVEAANFHARDRWCRFAD